LFQNDYSLPRPTLMFLLRVHNHQARRHGAEVFMTLRHTQWQWRELAFRNERIIGGRKHQMSGSGID